MTKRYSSFSYINGHKIYFNEHNLAFEYEDGEVFSYWDHNNECIGGLMRERPCPKCNKLPINGHDACIVNLPGVKNACCGHGVKEGYIHFTNDVIIRGYFNKD